MFIYLRCMNHSNRRNAIKAIAAGIGSISTLSMPAVGSNLDASNTGKRRNIGKRVNDLFQRSNVFRSRAKSATNERKATQLREIGEKFESKAVGLLEENNMDYKIFESTSKDEQDAVAGDEVTTNDRYVDDNGTTIRAGLFEKCCPRTGSGPYYAQVYFELHEDSAWFSADNVCPPDGCAIYWNDFAWQPVNVGRDGFLWPYSWAEGIQSGESYSVNFGDWDARSGGVVAEINDPEPASVDFANATFMGGFTTELYPVRDDAVENFPITVKYKHTWRNGTGCTFANFGVTLNFGFISIGPGTKKDFTIAAQS